MNAITEQYKSILQNFEPIKDIGKSIAMSGMFGCQDAHQGLIIVLDCYVRGMPLLEYQSRNHMIMGKPSMKYDAMLADFDAIEGCRHAVIDKTPEKASVAFFQTVAGAEVENVFTLTWDEAQKEAFPYEGKESAILEKLARGEKPPLKAKYATPRSRAIMLFARCVSDAIRSIAPQVSAGRYTPEEIEDMVDVGTVNGTAKQVSNAVTVVEPEKAKAATEVLTPKTQEAPIQEDRGQHDSEQDTKQERTQALASDHNPESVTSIHASDPITENQDTTIRKLIVDLKKQNITVAPKIKEILLSKGLKELADLTVESADALIRALEKKEIEAWANSQIKSHRDSFSLAK
jgi:hypothetical protein